MENAKLGFKKLFTAEILLIIGGFVGFVPKEYWYLSIIFIVLDIIAFFMNMKGLKLMSQDLEGYNKAYKFAIAGIVIDIVSLILAFVTQDGTQVNTIINSTSKALSSAVEFAVAFLVLKTSVEYLESKGNKELAKYANTAKNLLTASYCIYIILDLFVSVKSPWANLAGIVLAIVCIVILLIGQFKYFIFLKRMSEAL